MTPRTCRIGLTHALAALLFVACSGEKLTESTTTTLLDTTVTLTQGVSCSTGGVNAEFTGQGQTTVTISASGAATLAPAFTLYAPDFATQLGGSTAAGAGKAGLTVTLTQTGKHYLTLCDQHSLAGSLRVIVTAPKS